jgi:uncharacterized protein YkwD
VLPALAAALVGAVTAGAATLLSNVAGADVPDQAQVALSVPDANGGKGGLSHPHNQIGGAAETSKPGPNGSSESPRSSDDPTPPSSSGSSSSTSSSADPSAPTSTEDQESKFENQVVNLVNTERLDAGCDPVRIDARLSQAAQDHSDDMAERDYFYHTTPEGVSFSERIVGAGYSTPGAENIARGQQNAEQVMKSWMESDGHRANILNCDLNAIGIGIGLDGAGTYYWTQDFGY